MILVHPKKGIAYEEVPHFVPAIIKNVAFPVRMKTLSWVLVFIKVCSVKICQTMFIRGEMGRHPVQDHTDFILMEKVDEKHEILRTAIAAGGSKITSHLVSPGPVERMFHHR